MKAGITERLFAIAIAMAVAGGFAPVVAVADPAAEPCLEIGVAVNSWEMGTASHLGIPGTQFLSTLYSSSIFNKVTLGNGFKLSLIARAYTGDIANDFNFSEYRTAVQSVLSTGINRLSVHGPFWYSNYNFPSQQALVDQLNALGPQQVRDYMRYVLQGVAHNLNRTEFNVAGHQQTVGFNAIDVFIEPIRDDWYNAQSLREVLRGNAPGSVNNFHPAGNSSYWARADTAQENYLQYAYRTAVDVFRQNGKPLVLAVDDYNITDYFVGKGPLPANKAEAMYLIVRETPQIKLVKEQMNITLPNSPAEIEELYNKIRFTADMYDRIDRYYGISGVSVRVPQHLGNDPATLQRQADTYRAIVQACVDAPNCFEVLWFGVVDPWWWGLMHSYFSGWGHALLFTGQWSSQLQSLQPKPAYSSIRDYLNTQTKKRLCARRR